MHHLDPFPIAFVLSSAVVGLVAYVAMPPWMTWALAIALILKAITDVAALLVRGGPS